MVTRREQLEALAKGEAGGDPGGRARTEAKRQDAQEGDLVGLVLREAPPKESTDDIPTRVKPPGAAKTEPKQKPEPYRKGTASERDLAAVGENLEEKIATIFGLASGIAPVTSTYAIENSPKALAALLDIARRRPAVLRALTKVADGADALEVAKFVVGILVCVQVDTGRLQGTELPARAFGVTEILDKYFLAEGQEPTINPNVTEMTVPSALRFQPVG
jgi:hypothetical protein